MAAARTSAESAKRFLASYRYRVGCDPVDAPRPLRSLHLKRQTQAMRVITDEDMTRIIRMHRNGCTPTDIGAVLGLWKHVVARLLILYGET